MLRPRISTNLAISADGKISSAQGIASGWTSPDDHRRLLELRKNADALLVGRGTLDADRMTLTVPHSARQPLRCIISHTGQLDPKHPIFEKPGGDIHLVVTGCPSPEIDPSSWLSKITLHRGPLTEFLRHLAQDLAVKTLHCEGGGQLIRELAKLDLIDEFHLTLAGHTLFGGFKAKTSSGIPGDFLPQTRQFEITHCEPRGGECFLTYQRLR
jgi:riboflavin-specific deaminase-like protein